MLYITKDSPSKIVMSEKRYDPNPERVQYFTGDVASFLTAHPGTLANPFSPVVRFQKFEGIDYFIAKQNDFPVPIGQSLGWYAPYQYSQLFSRLEEDHGLKIFRRIITEDGEINLDELFSKPIDLFRKLFFKKVVGRAEMKMVEAIGDYFSGCPSFLESQVIYVGYPLNLSEPETRRLSIRMNDAHLRWLEELFKPYRTSNQ